jgi:probable addiction module antidote protein
MPLKLSDWDASEILENDEEAQVLLEEVLKDGDAEEISAALGNIARSIGMTEIAKRAGISREQLYRAVNQYPRQRGPLLEILDALGVRGTDRPQHHDAAE